MVHDLRLNLDAESAIVPDRIGHPYRFALARAGPPSAELRAAGAALAPPDGSQRARQQQVAVAGPLGVLVDGRSGGFVDGGPVLPLLARVKVHQDRLAIEPTQP
jgi:hypothetical protein